MLLQINFRSYFVVETSVPRAQVEFQECDFIDEHSCQGIGSYSVLKIECQPASTVNRLCRVSETGMICSVARPSAVHPISTNSARSTYIASDIIASRCPRDVIGFASSYGRLQ